MSDLICPVCNGPIEPGDNVCKRCGFRLAGLTQAFSPVTDAQATADVPKVKEPGGSTFSLYVTKGPQVGEEFILDAHKITIGRDPHCDIFLNDMTVSREHAIITIDGNTIRVQDDDSLNGTWVDGEVVTSAELQPGSLLQIGTFNMVVRQKESPAADN
jgi:hypothetical protein